MVPSVVRGTTTESSHHTSEAACRELLELLITFERGNAFADDVEGLDDVPQLNDEPAFSCGKVRCQSADRTAEIQYLSGVIAVLRQLLRRTVAVLPPAPVVDDLLMEWSPESPV